MAERCLSPSTAFRFNSARVVRVRFGSACKGQICKVKVYYSSKFFVLNEEYVISRWKQWEWV